MTPGGVDPHEHIDQPSGSAAEMCDTFETASASAAAGGTTTVVCFVWQSQGESLAAVAADYSEGAKASRVDYAFHLTITDPTDEVIEREASFAGRRGQSLDQNLHALQRCRAGRRADPSSSRRCAKEQSAGLRSRREPRTNLNTSRRSSLPRDSPRRNTFPGRSRS